MSQLNQTKLILEPEIKREQTKFAKPGDEQAMLQLENISQKTNNREFKLRRTILYPQQIISKENGRNVSDTMANENVD